MGSTTAFKYTKVPHGKGVVVLDGVDCIVVTNEVVGVCCKSMETAVYEYRNAEGREYTLN